MCVKIKNIELKFEEHKLCRIWFWTLKDRLNVATYGKGKIISRTLWNLRNSSQTTLTLKIPKNLGKLVIVSIRVLH